MKKKLVLKALTDATFRKKLLENPGEALTSEELSSLKGGVTELIDLVNQVNEQALKVGTMIFCVVIKDPDKPPVYLA